MDCKGVTNDLLVDYGERLSKGDERAAIDQHLNKCRGCRVRYEEVKLIAAGVRTTMQAPVHKALSDQLDAAVLGNLDKLVQQAAPSVHRKRIFWASSIAVAASLVIGIIVWAATRGGQEKPADNIVKTGDTTPQPPKTDISTPVPPKSETPKPPVTVENPPAPKTENPIAPPKTETPAPPKTETPAPPKTETPPIPESPRTKTTTPAITDVPKVEPPKREPERAIVRGDFNKNGKVDTQDVAYLNGQIIAGRTQDPAVADLTGDGRVDCGDVLAMLQTMERNP